MPSTAELTQVGKTEDIADLIAVADSKATPLKTMIPKGKPVRSTFFEWQLDGYATPKTTGALDGEDVSEFEDAAAARVRVGVYVQELRRTPKVNQMAEDINVVAGINNPDPNGVQGTTEYRRAKSKKMQEIGRDIEATLLSANETRQQNGTDSYLTRGLGKYIQNTEQAVHPIPAAYRTPAESIYTGAIGSFSETSLRAMLQARWEATGSADQLVLICGAAVKNRISDFGRYEPNVADYLAVRRFAQQEVGKVTTSVDVYEGDYGKLEIHLSNFVPTPRTGYILDIKGMELRTKGTPIYKDLPDNGGGPRGLISAIIGLALYNPLAHCKIDATA